MNLITVTAHWSLQVLGPQSWDSPSFLSFSFDSNQISVSDASSDLLNQVSLTDVSD